ncbi:unnamed protein product [Timema podura]|uniref:Uncharacterized protein n=1 Tax=Timema podura TaxID=61482 RepID=A0ABN7NZW0_TIMPD|nr:unnamed protein product [Timema podura]
MEAVLALERQLQRFEETLNSFPLGACSANEASSVSAKIQEIKKTALLYQCAILFMKADQLSRNGLTHQDEAHIHKLSSTMKELEEKTVIANMCQDVWPHSLYSSLCSVAIQDNLTIKESYDEETAAFHKQIIRSLNDKMVLQASLNEIMKEDSNISRHLLKKKRELVQELGSYKAMIITQEEELKTQISVYDRTQKEDEEGYMYRKCSRIWMKGEWKTILEKNHPQYTNRDLNLDLLVIGSLVYCKSSALDHVAIEAGGNFESRAKERILKKLLKLNTMRKMTVLFLKVSDINFLEHRYLANISGKLRRTVTLKNIFSFSPREIQACVSLFD